MPEGLAYAGRLALSPALPLSSAPILDGSALRPVQWYFDNLLPEEAQHQLMATDAGIRAADAFGLLSYYGSESAGSLTLLPPGTSTAPGGPGALADAAVYAPIRQLPPAAPAAGPTKAMARAGAHPTLPGRHRAEQL